MALSKKSVEKACKILQEINPLIQNNSIMDDERNADREPIQNRILGLDKKSDGGWESVYINVLLMTAWQLKEWSLKKDTLPNSSFIKERGNGIITIGWY